MPVLIWSGSVGEETGPVGVMVCPALIWSGSVGEETRPVGVIVCPRGGLGQLSYRSVLQPQVVNEGVQAGADRHLLYMHTERDMYTYELR